MAIIQRYLFRIFCFLLLCSNTTAKGVRNGSWSGTFFLNDSVRMPFRFDVTPDEFIFRNARERIVAKEIRYVHDSVVVTMPVFDSEIRLKICRDTLVGVFINHMRSANKEIRFRAEYGYHVPLANDFELTHFSGRWSAVFDGDEPPLNAAVAEFLQQGNILTGTFLTPTGDYRYLDGFLTDGKSFSLSAFDGSHVFYFTATLDEHDTLRGHYYSGTHWHDTWKAWRNEMASLPDPDSLAFLKKGFTGISFSFPDADSNVVSLNDPRFKDKVVLVQIMGSWCPNCMDETAVLSKLYEEKQKQGLEIIGLDFERINSFKEASLFIRKFQNHFPAPYPILFAGSTDRKLRSQAIPELKEIVAFPTLIFIDRKGIVRKIHTGFSGPATGAHYETEQDRLRQFTEKLLAE